jgi:hypothetical protein
MYFVLIRCPSIGLRNILETSGIRNADVSGNIHLSQTLEKTIFDWLSLID